MGQHVLILLVCNVLQKKDDQLLRTTTVDSNFSVPPHVGNLGLSNYVTATELWSGSTLDRFFMTFWSFFTMTISVPSLKTLFLHGHISAIYLQCFTNLLLCSNTFHLCIYLMIPIIAFALPLLDLGNSWTHLLQVRVLITQNQHLMFGPWICRSFNIGSFVRQLHKD